MYEITKRLHENKQVALAKEILENAGYKVTKKLQESSELPIQGEKMSNAEAQEFFQGILNSPEKYGYDEYPEYLEIAEAILNILKKDPKAVYYADIMIMADYDMDRDNMIIDTGNDYFCKGVVYDEDGNKYAGYFDGNRDGMMNFLYTARNI